ncbi:tetratricopeptide repeat protein [Streptococcus uberis]|uniref:Tetratricopeptide repeat protein n=2 Tax=Streptococcus uberis TaxID=1349 RepID=B9DUM8_STRU0|nr:tetratricopeptide repeat protein [Streptococcus uberis]MTB34968.1 tetratricopeptide repeat protein [Streptococcus uberis]MTB37528.1 tetratricopeptide repeat protein [Streptococcus uberis]MTB55603.1 tetratricopeptide repeat protein [Streptococcus uberis]MTB59949.1 tetratricopeptide repeat protein [Streptococcus uberis]MTB77426.1 tetratricopeptide repeat protein [Streptococcus uberis]
MLNSEKMIASIEQQDLEHANKYFQKALKTDDDQTLLALGDYLESIGFFPQAKEIYLALKEDYPEVYLNLAQIAADDNQIEEAFLYLDHISPESDDYVNALLVMADLYDLEGLTDVAREKLLEAREISQDPLIIFGLAETEMSLSHFKEAIDLYASLDNRDILAITGVSTYQRIGRAYAALGKFEAAIEFLEKANSIEYDDDTVYELAILLFEQEEYQKANLYFKQLETMNPDYLGYEYVYAQSLHAEHKTEEAMRLVQQALRKNEFDSQLLLLASQLAFENHDMEASESYLLKAKEVATDLEEVHMRLSTLYLDNERYHDVIALEENDIENLLTKWNIARAYQELERDDQALSLYRDLEKDLADNPEFLEDYLRMLRLFGMKDKAISVAKTYLNLVPDDMNMQVLLDDLRSDL